MARVRQYEEPVRRVGGTDRSVMSQRAMRGLFLAALAAVAASAALGLLGGVAWSEVAPRAALQEVSAGTAAVVNAETRAFIGADAWYCLIAVVAGLLTGLAGFRLGIARRARETRLAVTTGLILGAVAGAYVMLWLGQRLGDSSYAHNLADAPAGATFSAPLVLGAKSAITFWPLVTSVALVLGELGGRRDPGPGPGPEPQSSLRTAPPEGDGAP